MVGCAGSVTLANAAGTLAPTHNYWTNEALLYSGFGSNNCSVSTTTGFSCGMDNPMHVCTASGTDTEGNSCVWTHCGLNTTSPDQFFGGCGDTAGVVCMTGP